VEGTRNWFRLVGWKRRINLSGKLLGAHVAHAGLIVFWCYELIEVLTSFLKTNVRTRFFFFLTLLL
jgi:hypothetical protein